MDIFKNKLNPTKFSSTNYIWNQLGLNKPWSVGYVSSLVDSDSFVRKEDWVQSYYQSGEERLRLIEITCTEAERIILLDYTKEDKSLPKHLKQLNLNYGRTELELRSRSRYMYEQIVKKGNPLRLTYEEVVYMVKYRVLCETWNGVIAREKNTISVLQSHFPELSFVKTDVQRDYDFGIDYEIFREDELLCALQIKPESYKKGHSPEIMKAKNMNEVKNSLYKEKYKADVLYVYANNLGSILNLEVLSEIVGLNLALPLY